MPTRESAKAAVGFALLLGGGLFAPELVIAILANPVTANGLAITAGDIAAGGALGGASLTGASALGSAVARGANGPRRLLYIAGGEFTDRELEVALQLSKQGRGYVVLRDPINVVGRRTSDLLIDGVSYDIYTPMVGTSAKRIISSIAKKNSQANGVVLDLSRNSVTDAELGNVLRRVQGVGATNIQDVIILR